MSNSQPGPPGLPNQAGVRTTARVAAVGLLVVGPILLISGFASFASGMDDPMASDGGSMVAFAVGGLCCVLGLVAANVGWLRAQATYVAGETMPVAKDSAAYLSDGQGLAGIGRTTQPDPSPAGGPYCRQCGTRNDTDARFCDGCGQSLA